MKAENLALLFSPFFQSNFIIFLVESEINTVVIIVNISPS